MCIRDRLRFAYIIKCKDIIKDDKGNIIELICTYDPETKSGSGTSTKKVKSAIHWVSANNAIKAQVNLYSALFSVAKPTGKEDLNPNSLEQIEALIESSVSDAEVGDRFQFERNGYFILDADGDKGKIFNRIITLKDTWAKVKNK